MYRLVKVAGYCAASIIAYVYSIFEQSERSAIILMYHSFENTEWKYGVRPKELGRQLAYLVKRKKVVPFADVVAFAKDTTARPHTHSHTPVAITVDDVYADTYTVLFPLLKKYNIHAALFLTTDLTPREKLSNLARPTWDQLREMHASGLVSVEVHGRTHVNWTEIEHDEEKLRDEILGARDDIERELGVRPRYAAYPAGRRSKKLEAYLKAHGFDGAVAITEGAVYAGDNPFTLKRVQVDRTMSFMLFKLRLMPATLVFAARLRKFVRRKK